MEIKIWFPCGKMQSDSCRFCNDLCQVAILYSMEGPYSNRYACFRQICSWTPTLSTMGWGLAGRNLALQLCPGCWHWYLGIRSNAGLYLGCTKCMGKRMQKGKGPANQEETEKLVYCWESNIVTWSLMLVIIKVTSHPSSQCPHGAMGAQVMNLREDTQWMVEGRLEPETTNSDPWAPALTPLSLLLLVDQWHEPRGISVPGRFGIIPRILASREISHGLMSYLLWSWSESGSDTERMLQGPQWEVWASSGKHAPGHWHPGLPWVE